MLLPVPTLLKGCHRNTAIGAIPVITQQMQSLESFVQALPKVELHAHINGSVREETMLELAPAAGKELKTKTRSLSQCFALFKAIHDFTTDLDHVRRITREAIEDFAKDGVIYLELRTTPKHRLERGISKSSYMKAVMEGRDEFHQNTPECGMHVRFILSIDRRESAREAMETVELARRLRTHGVVGIDLSGDPLLGRFTDWTEALTTARAAGLKLTFHAGEVVDHEETMRLVQFRPERLGHMCFDTDAIRQKLYELRIPLELCLTSNLLTKSVSDLNGHHIIDYYRKQHPFVLCTDDPGIFATTLTKEYLLAAEVLKLNRHGIFHLSSSAVEFCFCEEETKSKLRHVFSQFERDMFT